MDWMVSGVRYCNPRLSWDENDRARTRQGSLVDDCYGGAILFHNENLLSIVVHMKRNRGPGLQSLGHSNEVFGPAILLVNLNDEFRNGTRSSGERLFCVAAQQMLSVAFLQDKRMSNRGTLTSIAGSGWFPVRRYDCRLRRIMNYENK